MNNIAFYIGSFCVMWHGILMGLGVLAAILSAFVLRRLQGRPMMPIATACVVAAVLVPLLSRFVYWYCSHEQFSSFWAAMTGFRSGGQSILGALCGLLLSGIIAHKLTSRQFDGQTLGELYDCLLPSGVLGTAVGRLAGLFDPADKGKVIVENPSYQKLPFSVAVADVYTGEVSWRLAVFLFESIAAFGIFIICFFVFRNILSDRPRFGTGAAGVFALGCFCAAQCVFDSMKYDALFLRSNGFVCLMQIFGIVVLLACVVSTVVGASRSGEKLSGRDAGMLIAGTVVFLVNAGYMEYYVQRHGNLFLMCYTIMFISLAGICAIILLLLGRRGGKAAA